MYEKYLLQTMLNISVPRVLYREAPITEIHRLLLPPCRQELALSRKEIIAQVFNMYQLT